VDFFKSFFFFSSPFFPFSLQSPSRECRCTSKVRFPYSSPSHFFSSYLSLLLLPPVFFFFLSPFSDNTHDFPLKIEIYWGSGLPFSFLFFFPFNPFLLFQYLSQKGSIKLNQGFFFFPFPPSSSLPSPTPPSPMNGVRVDRKYKSRPAFFPPFSFFFSFPQDCKEGFLRKGVDKFIFPPSPFSFFFSLFFFFSFRVPLLGGKGVQLLFFPFPFSFSLRNLERGVRQIEALPSPPPPPFFPSGSTSSGEVRK